MKKTIFALLGILVLSAFAAPRHKPGVKCFRQATPFVVDGKTNDWKVDSLQFDNKTGFAYAFSNDGKDLFVQLKMLNTQIQRKALITGLTLWIDPAGKGKRVLGIEYPQGRIHNLRQYNGNRQSPNNSFGHSQQQGAGKKFSSEQRRLFNERLQSEPAQLEGFEKAGIKNAFVGENGIRVLLQMDSLGHAVYEAKIPLKMLFSNPAEYLSKKKPFSVTFQTGYIEMRNAQMMMGGHRGMGGRGGMGGGMGGGRGMSGQRPDPSRMAMMQSMAESSRLKVKTVYLSQTK